MKATVTLKVKLETTEQVSQSLAETQKAHAIALNHTSQVAFEKKVFNSVALHHVTYQFDVLFAVIRIMPITSLLTISPFDTLNSDASP